MGVYYSYKDAKTLVSLKCEIVIVRFTLDSHGFALKRRLLGETGVSCSYKEAKTHISLQCGIGVPHQRPSIFIGHKPRRQSAHVLGKYYRGPTKSGLIPFHLIKNLLRSLRQGHYVSDTGEIVYYQTDPELYKFTSKNFE
ncbi:hypothetical protein CRG98_030306 [Punica granatum]|uniref:Uncharacterized protein n=1 Tax=Punica granatum TaxID=22663 RepID=A0A2I0IZF1_PUNGR|nr:hypothetical protein CRG98_030306 [Punica granatum]